MGQRREKNAGPGEFSGDPVFDLFPTDLGWFVLQGHEGRVTQLRIGLPSQAAAEALCDAEGHDAERPRRWNPKLVDQLQDYASGTPVDFSDVEIDIVGTPFRKAIYERLREVPYGRTLSYAELAAEAGRPKAARAVGSAMACNAVPLVIPCHRVVGSANHLGGFSAPGGVDFKRRLLQMESRVAGISSDVEVLN